MKILGSDLDGTFGHGGVDEAKLTAVREWRARGNVFGIISGRGGLHAQVVAKQHPNLEMDFFASCNGGLIFDGNGKVIYEARCTTLPLINLVKDLLSWNCVHVFVIAQASFYVVTDWDKRPPHVEDKDLCLLQDLPTLPYFNQVSVALPTVEETLEVVGRIQRTYGECLTPLQNGTCIDIVPKGVNKAQGLYRVMEHFGGTYDEVIAVGDNYNDADMLKEFRSYAMAHSDEAIRGMANDVTENVTDLLKKEMGETA